MVAWTGDFEGVLRDQNPWLGMEGVPDVLAPPTERPLAETLWQRLQRRRPRRFHLIIGPRRVGKTTVMYQTIRHLLDAGVPSWGTWWFRLDHPVFIDVSLGDVVRGLLTDGTGRATDPCFVFLDELVYAKDWDLWLKTFYDEHWPVHIIATSSATAALTRQRVETGVGRWDEHHLGPYSFAEFVELAGDLPNVDVHNTLLQTLTTMQVAPAELRRLGALRRRFLLIGGFPELLLAGGVTDDDEENVLLRSQQVLRADAVERAIYKDIPQSFGIDNPMALERLLYVLAGQTANLLSPTSICQSLGLSQPTFDRYVSYLERAFLIFTLPNYSGSEGSVQRRGRKLYFVDGAVRNAALQRGLGPLTNAQEMGVLLENLVASELRSYAEQSGWRLFHWRDGKHEVDLVLDEPDEPLAIEVGLSADHSRAGLRALADRYPKFVGKCWVVAPDATFAVPSARNGHVGTLPVDAFLIAVGHHAAAAAARRLGVTSA
jgi:predicted AAA+ superfamily ATPase